MYIILFIYPNDNNNIPTQMLFLAPETSEDYKKNRLTRDERFLGHKALNVSKHHVRKMELEKTHLVYYQWLGLNAVQLINVKM